jgi:hypothetical protein
MLIKHLVGYNLTNIYCICVMDLEILIVLITRLLRRDLNRLVNGIEPMELWDKG